MPANPAARPTGATGAKPGGDKVAAAYQDLLQEIAEKKKTSGAIPKRRPRKSRGAVIRAILAVLLPPVVASIWIFKPFSPPPPAPVRPPDEASSWQTALLGASQVIVAWRDSVGVLPNSRAEAGVVLPGADYTTTGDSTFSIRSFAEDRTVAVYVDGHLFGMNSPPIITPPPAAVPLVTP